MDKNKVDEYLNESLLVAKKQIEMIDEFMVIAEQITNKMKKWWHDIFLWKLVPQRTLNTWQQN